MPSPSVILYHEREITLVHPSSPISLDDFTPFGEDNGDVLMPSQLDAISDKINTTTVFPLFGRKFTSLYVSKDDIAILNVT
ncbi:hypothetical protein AC249_AIPGENE19479 [Exaiptasia diaphana]|nr:hypothetical protein AC249_AIPGENE19479 [Exaiptasia diaphana]